MIEGRHLYQHVPISRKSTMVKKVLKYKKAPQAPRRFKSSYMFFSTEKHKAIRQELTEKDADRKLSTTDVAKMVSRAWKALSAEDREKWEDMARRDKARFEMEKAMYTGPWKVPAKKRSQKDPNAPKRPMSAFLSFSNSKRSDVKNKNPDITNAEVSRILAQLWKDASQVERKDHIDKEYKLRQEYKVAIAEWRQKSEEEMVAARKEREDEAMKAVMEGKPIPNNAELMQNSHEAAYGNGSEHNYPMHGHYSYGTGTSAYYGYPPAGMYGYHPSMPPPEGGKPGDAEAYAPTGAYDPRAVPSSYDSYYGQHASYPPYSHYGDASGGHLPMDPSSYGGSSEGGGPSSYGAAVGYPPQHADAYGAAAAVAYSNYYNGGYGGGDHSGVQQPPNHSGNSQAGGATEMPQNPYHPDEAARGGAPACSPPSQQQPSPPTSSATGGSTRGAEGYAYNPYMGYPAS